LHIEVDQSGKIEKTNIDTVLAFSNEKSATVLIPAQVKRTCLQALRPKHRRKTLIALRIFAAGLFLLLEEVLREVELLTIDQEYLGHEGDIKGMLFNLIWQAEIDFDQGQITFQRIGKRSAAHRKAIGVLRGSAQPDRVLQAEDILQLLL
jgi:hypothetical protein